MRRPLPAGLLVLGLLLLAALTAPATAAQKDTVHVLLLTHPKAGELKNLDVLLERELLRVPGLKIIGLVHDAEYEHYRDAKRYIESREDGRMELLRLDCAIAPHKIFARNGCTERFAELVERSDGVIFTGGPDIPPRVYGAKTLVSTSVQDPPRHRFELSFLFHLLQGRPAEGLPPLLAKRVDYMVLGQCLGMQSMNVATGGSLVQDIPTEIYGAKSLEDYGELPADVRHRSTIAQLDPAPLVGWAHMHRVRFDPKAPLSAALGVAKRPPLVLSLHHQAVEKLGTGWRVLARSMDRKVVEAMEHERFPHVMGVQFHPEKRILYNPNLIYRQRADDQEQNFVFAAMRADVHSRAFLKRFWAIISERLKASRKSRPHP